MKQFCRWQPSEPKHHGRQAPRNVAVHLAGEIDNPVRTLQQNYGNQAVQRLIQDGKVSLGLMWYLRSTTGNHARQRAVTEMNQGPSAISDGRSAEPVVVQRLPTLQSFKDQTKLGTFDKRNKVVEIDRALAAYHRVPVTEYQERLDRLLEIRDRCQMYLGRPDKVAKRKDGVRWLRDQVETEINIFRALAQSQNAAARIDQFRHAADAQNRAAEAEAQGYEVGESLSQTGDRLNDVLKDIDKNESQTLQTLIKADLDRLQDLAQQQNIPELTKQILREVLGNRQKITFAAAISSPGASADRDPGLGAASYTVKHSLSQRLGETERLGSLAHELTHVSAGESYRNTMAFLLYDRTLRLDQIVSLARQRNAKVDELEQLCQQDETFSAEQQGVLLGKIDYLKRDMLGQYMGRFGELAIRIENKFKDREAEVRAKDPNDKERIEYERGKRFREVAEYLKYLCERIPERNSVLVEYDSVVNQMLLYMYLWHIPQENRFYAKLNEIAQEVFTARQQARERNRQQGGGQ